MPSKPRASAPPQRAVASERLAGLSDARYPIYTNGIIDRFVGKLISEYEHPDGGTTAAILLTNNCSDTRWFHLALSRASCVCLVRDRLWFSRMGAPGKRAARGQVIFYFGPDVERFMHAFAKIGGFVRAVT